VKRKNRRESNPVAKNMEKFNRPKTIRHKRDKLKAGYDKYPKSTIEKQLEEE